MNNDIQSTNITIQSRNWFSKGRTKCSRFSVEQKKRTITSKVSHSAKQMDTKRRWYNQKERDSHTINCVHENQKQLGGNINRHEQPSTQEWPLQTSRLTSSFAPISNAASMRGRKKSPSQNQPSNNNRRTPNEGDTIWRIKHLLIMQENRGMLKAIDQHQP